MKYERYPIVLDTQTITMIQLFHRTDNVLEDLWINEIDGYEEVRNGQYEKSAKQLLDQLEDHYTPQFLMELRKEITRTLQEHDNEFGTSFA